ncbi:large conductance mechanosensitive channel protein [Sphaerochaeta pleomorpha str. Grapes]|uniref:Large-conductance mechanosensitive channel n=1 Tax=Sphaerochaeta pleomorpha (strain ATCC BAA-1885 / DSM 22778 / Grapes) TaxID=158190 RepID=G8QVV2_SPHPG|nr:large-conductance mechanosensitive channel protein MscL [Sphaerochaeta pleomorpha]AEV30476.1 large conductance mechanosensitive channel protein [Sphaerochaeta pleomorpha str. Grapes]
MAKKSGFLNEFKQFISRGNVMDLAVGIIIGTAFTAIVNSLVKDIIMPFVGLILGGVSFTDLKVVITAATADTAEVALTYGNFIQRIIDFLIIALVVFMIVKMINKLREKGEAQKKAEEAAKPAPKPVVPADVVLLTEIRDLLKKQK